MFEAFVKMSIWRRHYVTHKPRNHLMRNFRQKTNMAARKKDGAPDWKYFESAETIALFEPVKQYLLKNCKKVIITWFTMSVRNTMDL